MVMPFISYVYIFKTRNSSQGVTKNQRTFLDQWVAFFKSFAKATLFTSIYLAKIEHIQAFLHVWSTISPTNQNQYLTTPSIALQVQILSPMSEHFHQQKQPAKSLKSEFGINLKLHQYFMLHEKSALRCSCPVFGWFAIHHHERGSKRSVFST